MVAPTVTLRALPSARSTVPLNSKLLSLVMKSLLELPVSLVIESKVTV